MFVWSCTEEARLGLLVLGAVGGPSLHAPFLVLVPTVVDAPLGGSGNLQDGCVDWG